jgi:outer membrane protein OmpA-like peptidoglycan-associated protein
MRLQFLFFLFIVTTSSAQENLFTKEKGVKIVGFSSSYGGGWDVENLVPSTAEMKENDRPVSSYVWCSADNQFPQWVVFELSQPTWLTTFVMNNRIEEEEAYPGISAKDVELWVMQDGSAQWKKWTAARLEKNKNGQELKVEPVKVTQIKLLITSNWGNPYWTEFNAMGVYDDGTRPQNISEQLAAKKEVNIYGIYFDFGSANLKAESQPAIDQLLDFLSKNPGSRLLIEGHTDNIGTEAANQRLSEQRANSVVDKLVSMKIAPNRLQAAGQGSKKPVADNKTETGRSQNRRVSAVYL